MPNIKVANVSAGMYSSDSPEQVPEVSWTDLVNYDFVDLAIETRDGLTQYSTTPLHAGCLKFGYSAAYSNAYLNVQDGDFGAVNTDSRWSAFLYAKEGTGTTTTARAMLTLQTAAATVGVSLGWDASDNLSGKVRAKAGGALTEITYAGGRTATTHLYGVEIVNTSTTDFVFNLYDHTGVVATTNISASGQFSTQTEMYVAADTSSTSRFFGHMGELILTKDITVDTTFYDSRNLPPGDMVATAEKIAYYPLQRDLDDKWGLQPSFRQPPIYETGGGLENYDVDDAILTSPQAKNPMTATRSWHVNCVEQEKYLCYKSISTVSSTHSLYLNGEGRGSTIAMSIEPVYMGSSSASYTIFSCDSGLGPMITAEYKDTSNVRLVHRHRYAVGADVSTTVSVPFGRKSTVLFDVQHTVATSTLSATAYRDWGAISSTTADTTALTASTCSYLMFGTTEPSTHSTTSVSFEAYIGCFLMFNQAVATTWVKKPASNLRDVSVVSIVDQSTTTGIGRGGFNQEERFSLMNPVGTPETVTQVPSIKEVGSGAVQWDRNVIPNFSSVFLAYFFNEVSGYDHATQSTFGGVIHNGVDKAQGKDSWLEGFWASAPSWVMDRNSVGLISTNYLATEYEDEFQASHSFRPTNQNVGNQLLFGNNTSMVDSSGTTISFNSTWNYGKKKSATQRGMMYGNSLYFFNDYKMFRYDGRSVFPIEQITPTMPLTVTAGTLDTSGINGAYMYTYTFMGKNGIESRPALATSCTVSVDSVSISLDTPFNVNSYVADSIASINIYRNKGSVGTASTLVNNNGTYFYLLSRIPIKTARDNYGSELLSDKVSDSALGTELTSGYTNPMPPCRYGDTFGETAVFTGDPLARNHYYVSEAEAPEYISSFGDFRTEDGEENKGVASFGSGFIIFKESSRKYVPFGDELRASEWNDGGCMNHDTLVSLGDEVIGLGPEGFFKTNGHRYTNINTTFADGRGVSSIQKDVDSWSLATKRLAKASYHHASNSYKCEVNGKIYIFHTVRNSWRKYEDMVGLSLTYAGESYTQKKGWIWGETSSNSNVGGTAYEVPVAGGGIGYVDIVGTTTLPTTYGLPAYLDNTYTWVRKVTTSGTTQRAWFASSENFSAKSTLRVGVFKTYAQTKNFEARTPQQNKMWKRILMGCDAVANGRIDIQYGRNSEAIDDDFIHYQGNTTRGEIKTWPRARSRNASFRFKSMDGKKHTIKSYTIEYEQAGYGL